VINEEEATGDRTSDDTNGFSATGGDFGSGLRFGEGMILPAGLVGPFVVITDNKPPGVRELLELI